MARPLSDHRLVDQVTSGEEHVPQVAVTPRFSYLNTSDDMDDQEPLLEEKDGDDEEEEELIVLDPEHPLVRRQQAALKSQLIKQLERLDIGLREKRATEKADASHLDDVGVELFRVQEQLATLQAELEDHHHNKAQAEGKHRHTQDQLEAVKSQYSNTAGQDSTAKTHVSQLQTELDSLMQHLVYTQEVSEDLQSNVKALKNATHKAGAERTQAEDQKLKQDLYVERLTKDMERLTEQIALYDAQATAQAQETQAAKEAFSEAELEMESVAMARKQLFQQWNSSLVGMKKRDEALAAMQEAVRNIEHEVITLDGEIDGYKKSTIEEEEQNEILTMHLNWFQLDGASSKKLMGQRQEQKETLQAHYSTCLRSLQETERSLARLNKENSTYQSEVSNQRRQLEKESAVRLEVEGKIMTHIQQKLIHNKAAKYSQQLTNKIDTLKKEKISQLWQLENELVTLGLESSEISQHLDSLKLIQEALELEITNYNTLLTANQAKMTSFDSSIERNHAVIDTYNKKIQQIAANTGHEDLSPLQIQAEKLTTEIEELAADIKRGRQLWMRQQGALIALTQEREANSKVMMKLQTIYTALHQKKIRAESQFEQQYREEAELERHMKTLRGDTLKLNTLINKNRQLSQALEMENKLMKAENLCKLKEAERECVEMEMKCEKIQEDKERLQSALVEAEWQIMLWEKKTQLAKETRSAVDTDLGQGDIHMMKAEIHRMEVRLNQLMRQQERLQRESEATVARRETILLRREALAHSCHKQTTKGELFRIIQGLQRKIQDTHKHVAERQQEIRELQESKANLSDSLGQQKQHLMELSGSSYALDHDIVKLQDNKESNLAHLVALQNRLKQLQMVCEGRYQALSSSECVETTLQCQKERAHAVSTILHRVCAEFPQHQGALRRLLLNLSARVQALEQGPS
ncbi:coiled-coil domain-containing protein 40 [Genypterus blacodes]|uniref:coiled-coil domain-containing protein 40 n=1 Tax=Genypterus blacodes TaxID=154954 RepID=UPI003F76E271